jgi:hypothetical protein
MMPIVHRIEMPVTKPMMSRMMPRAIMACLQRVVVLLLAGCPERGGNRTLRGKNFV